MQTIKEIEGFLKNLIIPMEFGGNIDEDTYELPYFVCEDFKKMTNGLSFEWAHGVSKLVFIFNNSDWVVKIPFNGSFSSWDDEDENEETFTSFCGGGGEDRWDYCDLEVIKYDNLLELGLECFLAETRYLCCTEQGYPIYIQEKVIPCNQDSKTRTPSNKAIKAVEERDLNKKLGLTWVASAIDFYGLEKTEQFLNYIYNEDKEMYYDLHKGNYGYREDGSPCLLDYSGWNEY